MSDQQLISDYLKRGDQRALEILIKKYLKPVYNFVYRFVGDSKEAEDITQEVFVKVWRSLKRYDRERSFRTWVFAIAKNTSIDWLKKKRSLSFSSFENEAGKNALLGSLVSPDLLPDELFSRSESTAKLALATEGLSPQHKAVLSLYYKDQFNFREIAEKLGESLNTVKSRHRRALIHLRRLLVLK